MSLAQNALSGELRAIAKILTAIEDEREGWIELIKELHPYSGRAYVLGITGIPGAGKSTLTDKIITHLRRENDSKVAVIAVDPSSPFSGGAILADRIRMHEHFLDEKVFIRSMATRGCLGGLSKKTVDVAGVLDASGFDWVVIETVGVGQDEIDVVKVADTTVVVFAPGTGDEMQAMKAGIMEIGDIFVVNKADNDGAEKLERELNAILDLSSSRRKESNWDVPVVKTIGTTGEGVDKLISTVMEHRKYLESMHNIRLEKNISRNKEEIINIIKDKLLSEVMSHSTNGTLTDLARRVALREIDPYTAAESMIKGVS
ncbi:MAG: methylmalonyl Co-A mutase-associated GTPase MeaB [Candidatus Schekmanbacteria bacterium]|nr:methylmalonyl Co-A mutase-associated GTPase MeaB [Candidatus Schekmanbacteria bacterium]